MPEPKRSFRQSPPIRHWVSMLIVILALVIAADSRVSAQSAPISSMSDLNLATREYERGNFDAAMTALDRFEKASSPNLSSLDLRGLIYMEQQKFDAAKKAFEDAHAANRNFFAPLLHQGDLLMRQKKFEEARTEYQRLLLETNVLMSNERLRFGVFLSYLGEHGDAGAKAALDAIKFPTQTAAYYYAQAAWAFAHKKESEGQESLTRARSIYPENETSWFAQHLYYLGLIKKKPPLLLPTRD